MKIWLSDDGTLLCEHCLARADWPSGQYSHTLQDVNDHCNLWYCADCGDHILKTCETCDAFDHVDNRVRGYVDAGDAWDECDECRNEA